MTEIELLEQSIRLHSQLYDNGTPLITDGEYDELLRKRHRLLGGDAAQPVAPAVVGAPVPTGNPKMAHPAVMLSLNNASDQLERAEAWHAIVRRIKDAEGYADLKIDGMALRLDYQDGALMGAATRGDGTIGENVFENALQIVDVPRQLRQEVPGRISVVGEAYIPNSHFILLNNDREQAGDELYTSPRNTVAGGMRHSDPEEVATRGIRFFAYGLLHSDRPRGFAYHSEVMEWLAALGFKVVEHGIGGLRSESDIEGAFSALLERSRDIGYDCDGVVVKLDNLSAREILGAGRTAPNWAFACKFAAKAERTRLNHVYFSVGRTGAVTPVGEVQPVVIGDVTISRLTLHNKDVIDELDLRIGDSILVKRAGDVIPAVAEVFTDERAGDERRIEFPSVCPACGSKLVRPENEARIYCRNTLLCPEQLQRGLEHFVGQDYMAVRGVGPALIRQLIAHGLVEQVADLYRLRAEDVSRLDGFGPKKTQNLLREIRESKNRPLHKLLAALGIREVGRSASEKLVEHFGSLDRLLDATYDEVRQVESFGPKMAESFVSYMENASNRKQLLLLQELGVGAGSLTEEADADADFEDSPLAGMKVCATGKLEGYTRGGINARIAELGGTPQGSVTKATDLLIVGERAGSKLDKARKLGVRVVTESEFEAMVA